MTAGAAADAGPEFSAGSRRALRGIVAGYVGFAALVTVAYAVWSARASQSWIMGEWLISYRAGFVRRGLIGELAFQAARAGHIAPMTVTLLIQVLLYSGFYGTVWLLARGVRWTVPLALLFFSPATLAFITLDPPSSVRKEVLLYLAVALLCLHLARHWRRGDAVIRTGRGQVATTAAWWRNNRGDLLLASAMAGAAAVIVLAHEGLVFFLPYLFAPVLLSKRARGPESPAVLEESTSRRNVEGWQRRWGVGLLLCLPAALVGLLAAGVSALHPGDARTADAICRSVGGVMTGDGRGVCGGAIAYLAHDRAYAHADVARATHAYHYGSLYGVTGVLAVLPLAGLLLQMWRAGRLAALRTLLFCTVTAAAGSVVLFAFGRDWGRWISIHVTCLLLLSLLLWQREQAGRERKTEPPGQRGAGVSRWLVAAGMVLYATCWNLPATGNYHARWGYAGLARYFASYRLGTHPASADR